MLRLDSGPGAARGDFRCSVLGCDWAKQGVYRQAAHNHMQRRHPGLPREITRTPQAQEAFRKACRRLPDEERKERDRKRARRYRAEVKVSAPQATPRAERYESRHGVCRLFVKVSL